ncbi:MAG TPA: sigma 54-interacting transcriptional regulator [Syntrophorhabdaceae bacterium]|nr:sigma 54-interacting transcriptional regulator [Syntrophorhabdaceae bacterium]MDI9561021.1 sigma 54-interacting transcriptional regulator [Pseudomonadota bacterium]MBP8698856.1 sigma 54-interacting transcriptional regulator [Syntrophorhabdaceae bacterium]MBV6506276.1 Anaerobic nitric oxide reductase transcription regulator NorR [Syntrophorhabdaceae bacterium]HNQ62638.1 sigma 54-interacting transcriptional regulator [Syntrophorhabdaceae bacterium]
MERLRQHIKKFAKDLEAIIENTYDGLYITDGNANTLMVNQAYERIAGIKRSEVLGKNMRDLVALGIIDRSVSVEVIDKKKTVTIMQEFRNGKKVLVTGSPVFNEDDDSIALVVTNVRDITELIELKDKLHERTLEANRYLAELDKIKILQQQKTKFATKNKKILGILELAIKAAQFDSNILIMGESGVGKGLMAKLIHESSNRKEQPFVVINCAGIPEDLFESELFGYEPGAFSGASSKGKKGLLEVADKGTVFLDEIGDMSLRLQAKLLRVIEEKEMTRLGSTKTVKLNIRIISATNQNMADLIEHKKFRQDLYFRLNTVSFIIPPLRERTEDIIPLIQYFTERLNERYRMKKNFSSQAMQFLIPYKFPGNVRELSGIVEQAFLLSNKDLIEIEDLPFQVRGAVDSEHLLINSENKSYNEIVNLMEYKVLKNAIEKYGSTHKVAKKLKISQSTIVRKMKKLNIKQFDAD